MLSEDVKVKIVGNCKDEVSQFFNFICTGNKSSNLAANFYNYQETDSTSNISSIIYETLTAAEVSSRANWEGTFIVITKIPNDLKNSEKSLNILLKTNFEFIRTTIPHKKVLFIINSETKLDETIKKELNQNFKEFENEYSTLLFYHFLIFTNFEQEETFKDLLDFLSKGENYYDNYEKDLKKELQQITTRTGNDNSTQPKQNNQGCCIIF
eukprot:TRINITY_DN274_c1_g1_i2.p1 TRINITY_DN274_c1_g1~~TRINITY_DN274_c1_g1_i2.p1  ORF type:complete len:211 (+),score=82.17 TRINITY_DN274_c1_g1_i2:76-708(+)